MIGLLRIVGLPMWRFGLGLGVFHVGGGTGFFFGGDAATIGASHAGRGGADSLGTLFHHAPAVCAGVALLHLMGEGVYLGRMIHRWTLGLLLVLLGFSLVAGYFVQPQLQSLHLTMYRPDCDGEEKETAGRGFSILHGVSQADQSGDGGGCLHLRGPVDKAPTERLVTDSSSAMECRGGEKEGLRVQPSCQSSLARRKRFEGVRSAGTRLTRI